MPGPQKRLEGFARVVSVFGFGSEALEPVCGFALDACDVAIMVT